MQIQASLPFISPLSSALLLPSADSSSFKCRLAPELLLHSLSHHWEVVAFCYWEILVSLCILPFPTVGHRVRIGAHR